MAGGIAPPQEMTGESLKADLVAAFAEFPYTPIRTAGGRLLRVADGQPVAGADLIVAVSRILGADCKLLAWARKRAGGQSVREMSAMQGRGWQKSNVYKAVNREADDAARALNSIRNSFASGHLVGMNAVEGGRVTVAPGINRVPP